MGNEMKWGICFAFNGNSVETDYMVKISQWKENHCSTKLVSEEINKSERAGLWQPQSGIPVGKLTILIRSFEVEKL